jgi:uncharacterized DUF497 family protein
VPIIFDGDVVIIPDERFNYSETRFIIIGILKNQAVVVVYTERNDSIRIMGSEKSDEK